MNNLHNVSVTSQICGLINMSLEPRQEISEEFYDEVERLIEDEKAASFAAVQQEAERLREAVAVQDKLILGANRVIERLRELLARRDAVLGHDGDCPVSRNSISELHVKSCTCGFMALKVEIAAALAAATPPEAEATARDFEAEARGIIEREIRASQGSISPLGDGNWRTFSVGNLRPGGVPLEVDGQINEEAIQVVAHLLRMGKRLN